MPKPEPTPLEHAAFLAEEAAGILRDRPDESLLAEVETLLSSALETVADVLETMK